MRLQVEITLSPLCLSVSLGKKVTPSTENKDASKPDFVAQIGTHHAAGETDLYMGFRQ